MRFTLVSVDFMTLQSEYSHPPEAWVAAALQRSVMTSKLTAGIRAILLDIEGTTTPISFVHEVLFSYARSHLRSYLAKSAFSDEVVADITRLREEHAIDVKQGLQPPPLVQEGLSTAINSLIEYVGWLIDRDRKSPGLKSLQGKIWQQGYLDGSLKAPLFADVRAALERWRGAGIRIFIFSSGSRLAQELLFAHSDAGDVTSLISGYFDTSIGKKTDMTSYRQITNTLSLSAGAVLFISDVVAELDAAGAAGMKTLLCVRPGNPQPSSFASYEAIEDFDRV